MIVKDKLLISQTDKESLLAEILEGVRQELEKNNQQKEILLELDLLTCSQVEELLEISHTTRIDWSKMGILRRHYMGSKVYYLRSEIKAALIPEEKRFPGRAA